MKKSEEPSVTLPTIAEVQGKIGFIEDAGKKASSYAGDLGITNQDEEAAAMTELGDIGRSITQGEAIMKSIVGPIKDHVKAIEAMFKPKLQLLEAAKSTIRMKLSQYKTVADAAAKKAQDVILAKAEEGKIKPETAMKQMEKVVVPQKTVRTEAETTTYVTEYELSVPGWDAENKQWIGEVRLPDAFVMPDMVKIRTVALANHKAKLIQIPGVVVTEKQVPRTRSNW